MHWLTFAIVAAALWGLVNLCDKLILTEHLKSRWTRMIADGVMGFVTCLAVIPFLGDQDSAVVLFGMAAGLMLYTFNYLYYKAIATADVSSTAAYLQIVPVFTAIWGALFFQELFDWKVYVGVALVISGVILVSLDKPAFRSRTEAGSRNFRAFLVCLLPGGLLLSLKYALQKGLLNQASFWDVYFWGRISTAIAALLIFASVKRVRQEVKTTIDSVPTKVLLFTGGVEIVNFVGVILLIAAYAIGPITLVTTAAAVQPLFVIIFTVVFGLLGLPWLLDDFARSRTVLCVRVLAVLILIIGVYLIVIN